MEATAYSQQSGDSGDNLVREYLPLVKKIGLHLVARLPPDIELDDLMQAGMIGLIQANSSYDPSQGASFSTYAGIRIKGAMLDEVRRSNWMSRPLQDNLKRVSTAISRLEARLGRVASDAEIAMELGISLEEYHDISRDLAHCRLTSLEDSTEEVRVDEADPSSQFENEQTRALLTEAIKSLPEREMLMMSLYYGEELNLKEIGQVMGVSESRVSQIHGQALARVRARAGEWAG